MGNVVFDPNLGIGMSEDKTGLLVCWICKKIEEIPHYNPNEADNDPRIGHIVENHLRRHPSVEDRQITEWMALGFVMTRMLKDPQYKKQIIDQILKGNGRTGFDDEFYDTVNTFKEDALACYQRHNRPAFKSNTQPKCADYLSHDMEIKPNTHKDRKIAGLPSYDESKVKKVYQCLYCPYHASVTAELRK